MPNLVGVHDPSASDEALAEALSRMVEAVDLPAFGYRSAQFKSRGVAIANVLPGQERNRAQPVVDPSERFVLFLDGEILNAEELVPSLTAAGQVVDGRDDAVVAMAAFLAFGADFHRRFVGAFNLVLLDCKERVTTIVTDRLGSRLMFWAEDGGRYVFASELKAVIAGRSVRSTPGGVGLYGLLMGGGHEGDRTWIEGIRLVPPGTEVRLSPKGREQRRFAKLRFNEGAPQMSEDDYAAGFARLLRTATERSMRQFGELPIAITLSGGLDSRAIALSIDRRHRPFRSITYGSPESPDVVYAAQLAELLGFQHLYIEPEYARLVEESEGIYRRLTGKSERAGFYSAQLDRIVWRSEGLSTFHGLASPIWHPIYSKEMRFMLNGAAGDAMTGSHLGPELLLSPRRDEVVRRIFNGRFSGAGPLVRKVLNPAFAAEVEPRFYPTFAGDFEDIDADEPTAIANIWDMENRQRRGSFTSFAMERYFCTCRCPFLDDELVDFLCSVPGKWRFQQRIYKRMLVHHYPEAAHVPWAYTEGLITDSPAFEFSREVLNFMKAKMKAKLPGAASRPSRWSFRDTQKMMREDPALSETLKRFARAPYFPEQVFDREGVIKLADDFVAEGGAQRQTLFSVLIALTRAIELFLVPPRIQVPPTANPAEFGVKIG